MSQRTTSGTSLLPGHEFRKLTRLNPARSLVALTFEWVFIAGAVTLHVQFSHPLVYMLSWLIISTRLYGLYSLMHDGIHFLLLKSPKANDLVTTLFIGLPLFISLSGMRRSHFDHHKHLKTDRDPEMKHLQYPEFQFPKSRVEVLLMFILDMSGINYIRYRMKSIVKLPKQIRKPDNLDLLRQIIYASLFTASVVLGFWPQLVLYWILPYITLYQALNRLRLSTEHFNLGEGTNGNTRSVTGSMLEAWFLSPHNLGYHYEHHLYPGVPFYNLPELHRILMEQEEFRSEAIADKSYIAVIRKMFRSS